MSALWSALPGPDLESSHCSENGESVQGTSQRGGVGPQDTMLGSDDSHTLVHEGVL